MPVASAKWKVAQKILQRLKAVWVAHGAYIKGVTLNHPLGWKWKAPPLEGVFCVYPSVKCLVWNHESWWFITVKCKCYPLNFHYELWLSHIDHIKHPWRLIRCFFGFLPPPLPPKNRGATKTLDGLSHGLALERDRKPVSTEPWLLEAYWRKIKTKVQVRQRKDSNPKSAMQFLPFHGRKFLLPEGLFNFWRLLLKNKRLEHAFSSFQVASITVPLKVPKNATNQYKSLIHRESISFLDLTAVLYRYMVFRWRARNLPLPYIRLSYHSHHTDLAWFFAGKRSQQIRFGNLAAARC